MPAIGQQPRAIGETWISVVPSRRSVFSAGSMSRIKSRKRKRSWMKRRSRTGAPAAAGLSQS
jgi:hypothetical protein